MSEIFGAVKLKNKIMIVSTMAAFALLLVTVIGVLNLVTVDTHTHDYSYSIDRSEDGNFNLIGICKVSNCESPYYAEIGISGVKLLMAESSTCSKEGKRVYSYTKDGVTVKYVENIPMAAHTYDFSVDTQGGVNYLYGKCTEDGCTNPNLFINNVEELNLVSSVPGSCFTPRQDTYSYVLNGEEKTFEAVGNGPIDAVQKGLSKELNISITGSIII